MGWTVGRSRHKEFVEWVFPFSGYTSPGSASFGALKFLPNGRAFSYDMCIARVFPDTKTIMYCNESVSRTTTQHISAVTGAALLLPNWKFLGVGREEMSSMTPGDAARKLWGPGLKDNDLGAVLVFRKLVRQAQDLIREKNKVEKLEAITRKYVQSSEEERDAMQAILELKLENQ
jgi:hypothetical protein